MQLSKQGMATFGLIFITFLAAIQYFFLSNVPDSVSTFCFLCITNAIGMAILGLVQFRKIKSISKETLKKGLVFALELTGFNFFTVMGSRNMDAVMVSSIVSLYFIFITPLLILLRKKVNFFSSVATVIAIIALLLMFQADTSALFSSVNALYLILADIFFAAYVVAVSVLGEGEDSVQLSFSQMFFGAILAFCGWGIECFMGKSTFSLPQDYVFWTCALFMGIFIRALYGVIQIWSQKYVSALKASLIFASEIIITLAASPILCALFGMEYQKATFFQVVGCFLFIIATLMVDETIMSKLGYEDLQDDTYVNEKGETKNRTSVSKKMIISTLTFSLVTLILATIMCLSAIHYIRSSAVSNSQKLGEDASNTSMQAMMDELEISITNQAKDKTLLAEQKLESYSDSTLYAARYAQALLTNPDAYPKKEVLPPMSKNAGKWVMQRTLADKNISYDSLRDQCMLLGNMIDVFEPIIKNSENISTIYIGTKDGLLISYDTYSDSGTSVGEGYFEFRETGWYNDSKKEKGYFFTDTYQDSYGRGLTITCVSSIRDKDGNFLGCVCMDVLMSELNASMVNDNIVIPSLATLIDETGKIIAGGNVDPTSEKTGTIFDENADAALKENGKEILEKKRGIIKTGNTEGADYIAYAPIPSTDWILCITTPVSTVIKPALTIRESIEDNTSNVVTSVEQGILNVIQSCLLLSALILLAVTLLTGRFSKRISDPLKKLEADVRQISGGSLDLRTEVDTDDEIGSLAKSFNSMTNSLQQYIIDLKEATAKEERIASELSVATNIQASMLPREFDIGSGRVTFFASMTPAKEVGGDFYDFFMIDDSHLALVMADVSGKGIPAALFMAKAKTSIKMRAMTGGTPSEILADVNEQMCEGNDEMLFVTVWFAIIDLDTGKGLAVNAGHEHPVLRRAGGQYELVVYRHSPAVAVMEGIPFRQHEFQLNPGDSFFVYTDGVAEATSGQEELYGTDRMLQALNKEPDAQPEEILNQVMEGINEFVAGEEQFDDITMLCLKYKG